MLHFRWQSSDKNSGLRAGKVYQMAARFAPQSFLQGTLVRLLPALPKSFKKKVMLSKWFSCIWPFKIFQLRATAMHWTSTTCRALWHRDPKWITPGLDHKESLTQGSGLPSAARPWSCPPLSNATDPSCGWDSTLRVGDSDTEKMQFLPSGRSLSC